MLLRATAAIALLTTAPCAGTTDSTDTTTVDAPASDPDAPLTDEEVECQIVDTLTCGDVATVDTTGMVNVITDYGQWVGNWSGPEAGFRLQVSGDVTVRIAAPRPSEINFDLFLMERSGDSSCDPANTIDYHWNSLEIEGASGTYTLFVDGVSGVSGEVTLEVTCDGGGTSGGTSGGGTSGGGTSGGGTSGGGTSGGGTSGGGTSGGGTGDPGGGSGSGSADTGVTPGVGGGPASGSSVCYPGVAGMWTTCVPTVAASSIGASGYSYGNASSSPNSSWYQPPSRYADLSAVSGSLPISRNFLVGDFMSSWKGRYAVFDPQVVVKMQSIRDAIGGAIVVNSGYRSPSYNAGVGGATWSRHMYGDAVDFDSAAASKSTLRSHCTSRGASFTKLYSDHVHCDWRSTPQPTGFFGGGIARGDEMTEFVQDPFDEGEDSWFVALPDKVLVGEDVDLELDWVGFPEGDPYVQWGVQAPWGDVVAQGEGPLVEFTPRTPGSWLVQAEVGGIVLVSERVEVR